jgi:hypothetical protein
MEARTEAKAGWAGQARPEEEEEAMVEIWFLEGKQPRIMRPISRLSHRSEEEVTAELEDQEDLVEKVAAGRPTAVAATAAQSALLDHRADEEPTGQTAYLPEN